MKMNAIILEALPNIRFRVELEDGKQIIAYLSGRMNKNKIKVLVDDKVIVELSDNVPIKNQVGRIVLRK